MDTLVPQGSVERRVSAIIPLDSLSLLEPGANEEGRPKTVGGIAYADNKRLAILKHDLKKERLIAEDVEAPPGFHPAAVRESNRIAVLKDYDEVHVGEVKFSEAVAVVTHASLDSKPTVGFRFKYLDASSPEAKQEEFLIGESSLMETFADSTKPVVQLKGWGSLKEEVGVVFTQVVPGKDKQPRKVGYVFFLRGQENPLGYNLDSVVGFDTFVHQLNSHLEARQTDVQLQVLKLFKDHVDNKRLVFDSPTREALGRLAFNCMARLGGERNGKSLESTFPELRKEYIARFTQAIRRKIGRPYVDTGAAQGLVTGLIRTQEAETEERDWEAPYKQEVLKMEQTVATLKTDRAKSLRIGIGTSHGYITPEMDSYIIAVCGLALSSRSVDELDDAKVLLDDARHTDYYPSLKVDYRILYRGVEMKRVPVRKGIATIAYHLGTPDPDTKEGYVYNVIDSVLARIVTRRDEVVSGEAVALLDSGEETDIKSQLKTPKAKEIYELGSSVTGWGTDKFKMRSATEKIWEVIHRSKNAIELEDMRSLLNGVRQTPFGDDKDGYYLIFIDGFLFPTIGYRNEYNGISYIHGSPELVDELLKRLEEKESKVKAENKRTNRAAWKAWFRK